MSVARSLIVLLFAGALVVGCGDDTSGDGLQTAVVVKVSGDSQGVALLGTTAPLVVQVLDTEGDTVAGAIVSFAVTAGAGTVTAADTADADGFASTVYHATSTAGLRTVRAKVGGSEVFFAVAVAPGSPATLTFASGNEQGANVSTALPTPLGAKVADAWGNPVEGVPVVWAIQSGGGSLAADTTLTNASGIATVVRTLGATVGGQVASAITPSVDDTLFFHATGKKAMTVSGGGGNVPERYTSDLWVQGSYGYSGTWGFRAAQGNAVKVWDVSGGAPVLTDSIVTPGIGTVSDNEVTEDGTLLLSTAESGTLAANGLYIYSLANPAHPTLVGFEQALRGLHTGTFGTIDGNRYVFASRNPHTPSVNVQAALMVYRIQPDSADKIVEVAAVLQPENYGIHDQFYRDGLLFASVWNTGLRIYDVGGAHGGSPATPMLLSTIVTENDGLSCNCVHNAWWYHDTAGGKRYVFVGQEGPGGIGTSSSGDIHVVDVSDLAVPQEVAVFHLNGGDDQSTGVHNFWMDESRGILYAAYYNGGVVALDVTGTLSGNLASREIARLQPGGTSNTYVWGVMLANGALWASDMVSGLWKLTPP